MHYVKLLINIPLTLPFSQQTVNVLVLVLVLAIVNVNIKQDSTDTHRLIF